MEKLMTTTDPKPVTIADIELACRNYDAAVTELEECLGTFRDELSEVKMKHIQTIKRKAGVVARCEAEASMLRDSAPALFVKPRHYILHGIKVGFKRSEGKLVYDDADLVVQAIRERFPDLTAQLIRTSDEPRKEAIKEALTEEELAAVHCRIEGAGDVGILARAAGDIDKLVEKVIERLVSATMREEG
jgi:hypothetical protein